MFIVGSSFNVINQQLKPNNKCTTQHTYTYARCTDSFKNFF